MYVEDAYIKCICGEEGKLVGGSVQKYSISIISVKGESVNLEGSKYLCDKCLKILVENVEKVIPLNKKKFIIDKKE